MKRVLTAYTQRLPLLAALMALSTVLSATAQSVQTNNPPKLMLNFAERVNPMNSAGMTPEQRIQFKQALRRLGQASLESYYSQTNGVSSSVRSARLKEASQAFDKELQAILSPGQYVRFKEARHARLNSRAQEMRRRISQENSNQ